MLPLSRLGCPLSLKTPNMGNPGQHLQALTGYDAPPIYEDARPGDVRHIALDPTKARRALGWEPRIGFLEGLEKTVAYMRRGNA